MALMSKKILLNENVIFSKTGKIESLNTRWKHFTGFLKTTSHVSGTINAVIQHSPNGEDWFDLITFTAISSNGAEVKLPATNSFFGCFPYVRANVTVSGSTNSNVLIELYYDEK